MWSDVFELVVSGEALDKVIMCNCNYADARDAVEDVVVSCNLGVGLYSFAIAATLEQKVHPGLTEVLDGSEWISRATLDQLSLAICQKLEALSAVTLLPQRRTVKVVYQGHESERQAKAIPQQVGLEVAA